MSMHVSEHERQLLNQLAREVKETRLLKRVQALLDLDSGDSPQLVSRRYHVARSTIYNWIKRYRDRGLTIEALRDLPRPGRPSILTKGDGQGGDGQGA